MSITINENSCISCGNCDAVCPLKLFVWEEGTKAQCPMFKPCVRCGHCVAACPSEAIGLDDKNPADLLPVEQVKFPENQQIALFRGRRSIRAYAEKKVERDVLEAALEHANYAPTASNQQLVSWILVEDLSKIKAIVAETIEWMRATNDKRLMHLVNSYENGGDPILRGAKQAIFAITPKSWPWGAQDASAALSYLELALHARGVGSCWTGFVISASKQNAVPSLELPEDKIIHAGLMLGYPNFTYNRIPERTPVALQVF